MNIYLLEAGSISRYIVADSEEHAQRIGSDPVKHPDLSFRAFKVTLVAVDGYTITVTQNKPIQGITEPSHIVHTLDRDGLKEWLTNHNIEFTPQWGEQKLRELALQHV